MDAVASNLGVDASKLVPEKKPEQKRKRSRSRDRYSKSPKRESKSVTPQPTKSSTPQPTPVKSENGANNDSKSIEQSAPLQPPPTIPAQSFSTVAPVKGAADAQSKAQQLELKKKLMDQGEPATLKQQEDMSIRGKSARQMVMQRLMGARVKMESTVLLLKNMVGPDDVDEELQAEIEEECNKYGKVENVIIYQERQSEEADAEIHVKIFVEFVLPEQVKKAKGALDGRFFGGRTVTAFVYDQELYDQQDFSG